MSMLIHSDKKRVYIKQEFNSHRTGLKYQKLFCNTKKHSVRDFCFKFEERPYIELITRKVYFYCYAFCPRTFC